MNDFKSGFDMKILSNWIPKLKLFAIFRGENKNKIKQNTYRQENKNQHLSIQLTPAPQLRSY